MARIYVVFDPTGRLELLSRDSRLALGAKDACMSLPDGLAGRDIYEVARKLAELLFEQIEAGES